jgi:ComF family protein
MSKSIITEIFQDFVSLIFPAHCLACENSLVKGENLVCTHCMLQMPQTNYHLDPDNALKKRLAGRIAVEYVMALFKFSKNGRVQGILHALKYKGQPELGVMLGHVYGERLRSSTCFKSFDLIIPIPLHPSRLRRRGYNQSAKFAEGLSAEMDIPFSDSVMVRKIKTATQTRKSKLNRWQNVDEVFGVTNPDEVKNKRILLVDDVITTGATLEACGNQLLNAGCLNLSIACIAEA